MKELAHSTESETIYPTDFPLTDRSGSQFSSWFIMQTLNFCPI